MHNPSRPKPPRRRFLQAAAAAARALVFPCAGRADIPISVGARLSADFDPVAAMWLGFDEGHAAFTADLFDALWPHVPIKMLVRDADTQVRWYYRLKREWLAAAAENRTPENPLTPTALTWRS